MYYREMGQSLNSVLQRTGLGFGQCITEKWVRVWTVYYREIGQSLNSVLQRTGSGFEQCITEKWSVFEQCFTENWVRV